MLKTNKKLCQEIRIQLHKLRLYKIWNKMAKDKAQNLEKMCPT